MCGAPVSASDILRDKWIERLVLSHTRRKNVLELVVACAPGVEGGVVSLQLHGRGLQFCLVDKAFVLCSTERSIGELEAILVVSDRLVRDDTEGKVGLHGSPGQCLVAANSLLKRTIRFVRLKTKVVFMGVAHFDVALLHFVHKLADLLGFDNRLGGFGTEGGELALFLE